MYSPNKDLGQNFLHDPDVIRSMITALGIEHGDTIVEIGAGLGAVTKELSQMTKGTGTSIYAIEIDERFLEKLNTLSLGNTDLKIIQGDVLKWFSSFDYDKSIKVIGSLPYYITSPIIHKIVRYPGEIQTIVILIQKEVAYKINRMAPDSSYLSTYVHTFYETEIIEVVPRAVFKPEPKVDGAVLKFLKKESHEIYKENILEYEGFLHHGYSSPRKMMNKVFSKEVLGALNIDDKLRPENLDVSKWIELYKYVKKR